MNPEEREKVKELFQAALEREPSQRSAFVRQACGQNDSLRAEVESLLLAYEQETDSFLEHPWLDPLIRPEDRLEAFAGRRFGSYRIIREIGRGGMAAVYLAARADEQFLKRVAIKLVRPGLDSEEILRRFRNERQTLATLDHPNIVKLLDGGSTEEGLPYLVMDYIEGVPVDKYCDNRRFSITERLQVFRAVCGAVSYAHQRLVIHRDLKPSNILVTSEGVPKLLDFGIAKLLSADTFAQTLVVTATAQRPMTLEYASPEQVRGEPLTNATDIYSLGVLLYELLTGHRPYHLTPRTPLAIERAICDEEPEKPSTAVTRVEEETSSDGKTITITPELVSRTREGHPDKLRRRLHGDLDTIVLKALRKEPQRRYTSVDDLSEDIRRHLEGLPISARPSTIGYRSSKFILRHKESVGVALILLALVVVLGLWQARKSRIDNMSMEWHPGNTFKTRSSVAVLGFKNLSGRPGAAWLSTALSEMLTTELAAGERLRTIPEENVARMKIDLSLPDADGYAPDTLARIRRILGSDYVVLGSYLDLGKESSGHVRLDVRLQDASQGETVASVSEEGTEAQLDDLVSRTGAVLRQKFGVGQVSTAEVEGVRASLPSNPEAARLYSQGLAKLRISNNLAARDLLEKALALEPDFALVHSALVTAWWGLGYETKAGEEAKRAFELSAGLPREERLWVEARYRETAKQWDKAVEIYKSLFYFFPDNLEYGLRLASSQTSAGKAKDALSTLEELRKLPPPARDDPRIDLAEADTAESLGDFRLEQSASERAGKKAQSLGAKLLVAQALYSQAWAYLNLGELKQASDIAGEAKQLYASAGDRNGIANAGGLMGTVLLTQGDLVGAIRMHETALRIKREIGNQAGAASALNQIANVLYQRGDLARAKEMYHEVLRIEREIGNKHYEGFALNNIAGVLHDEAELAEAVKVYGQALAVAEEIGDKEGVVITGVNMGNTLVEQGELAGATKMYQEVLAISRETGNKSVSASAISGLGDVLAIQGNLQGARKDYQEVLTARNEMGEKGTAAQIQLALAALSIEEGNPIDAEVAAQAAAAEFRAEKLTDGEIAAEAVLARSLLVRNKVAEAREHVDRARSLVRKSQNREVGLKVALIDAQVRAALGKTAEAERGLEATLGDARKYGYLKYQFEADLTLGEIEMKSGKTAAGHARLKSLEGDAGAKGFELIARKAAAAGS